jgi:6-bladed beta-propeller protein
MNFPSSPRSQAGTRRRMSPFASGFALLSMVAFLFASCLLIDSATAGEEVMIDGVLHIVNGSTPTNGIQDMELEEVWRIGGEDDEDVLLGIITRALIDDDDNIYLLDQQLSEVQVFSSDGEYLKTLGREGSGPGEVTRPGDFLFMPDGTLGLVQIFPGKIVQVNMDGTPAGEFNPDTGGATEGGFLALVNCKSSGGNLALSGIQITVDTSTGVQTRNFFLRSYNMDGTMAASIYSLERVWDFGNGFVFRESDNDFIWWRMDVGSDGRIVVCEPRYEYALSVYSPDGVLERVIDREYESWTRSDKIFKRFESIMRTQSAQFPPGTETETDTVEMDVNYVRVAKDGSIWTLPSRQMYEPEAGIFATYDVFTPEGDFDRQVRVICPGSSADDNLIFTGSDFVFQVTGFWESVLGANGGGGDEEEGTEPEPMEVICYRIK